MTIDELNELVRTSFELVKKIKAIEDGELKLLKTELSRVDTQMIDVLTQSNLNNFKSPYGSVVRRRNYSVTCPKSNEDKEKLFAWLREKNMFNEYVSVNSNSLKALYNAEKELALESGELDFELPGVGPPTVMESITRRK